MNTEILPAENFPVMQPCSLTEIFHELWQTRNGIFPQEESQEKLSMQSILGAIMIDVPVFNPSMLYETLGCDIPCEYARTCLSRLVKRKYAKSVRIDADGEIRTVYYVTRAGYNALSSMLGECREYTSKTGRRLLETAMHDYGVGSAYLSFVRSPFAVQPDYEISTSFDKAAMPSGKFLRKSLRIDAVLAYGSLSTFGNIYVEHDTGTERSSRMLDKLNLYYNHGILLSSMNGRNGTSDRYEQNVVLYTYRKAYPKRPSCFSSTSIKKLVSSMSDTDRVEDMTNTELQTVLTDLKKWTPAFKKHWNRENLLAFMRRVESGTDKSLIRYLKYYQRTASSSRRNSALRILMREYALGTRSPYYTAIMEMLGGYPVCFCASNNLDCFLPAFFMEDYPQTIRWLQKVLKPYYGKIRYRDRRILFNSSKPGGKSLCMGNIFETETDELVSVEYLSCDLSALMRLYAICRFEFDLARMPFKCVFLVDSFKDADSILSMMDPRFKQGFQGLHHGEEYDICFLAINGDHLFSVSGNGQEVRIIP